jgi:hypothetical protein
MSCLQTQKNGAEAPFKSAIPEIKLNAWRTGTSGGPWPAVLLALDDAAVAGQEAALLQNRAQAGS